MKKYYIDEDSIKRNNTYFGELYIENSNISFKGNNNVLFIDGKVNIIDSNLEFRGDNSIIYICQTDDKLQLDIKVYNNSVMYFGKNVWINKGLKVVLSEQTNCFFGNECLISYDTCIRTGDPHLIYNKTTHKRINHSKSFYAGDHVWIGQHVIMLKGAMIGSGAVIGAISLVTGKRYSSNCIYAGNPIKKIKSDIFFLRDNCHSFKDDDIEKNDSYISDDYIYEKDEYTLSFMDIEEYFKKNNKEQKIKFLKTITENRNKNRFYIE